jgi:hypothetical protein
LLGEANNLKLLKRLLDFSMKADQQFPQRDFNSSMVTDEYLRIAYGRTIHQQPGCVNAHGFSLHAAVRCSAHQRKELERLCRYITRPAIANERLKRNPAGQVVLQL